jgi:chromosome segregation ATPase
MTTGYGANKDNKGLEEERVKRVKAEQERIRKQHLSSDLMSKKTFLFSTSTTIDMKSAVMKTREIKMRELEGEIKALELKRRVLEQKIVHEQQVEQRLTAEENQKKVALSSTVTTRHARQADGIQIGRELSTVHAEIEKETHELEQKKIKLANLMNVEAELKKKKESLHINEQDSTHTKKMELDAVHHNVVRLSEEEKRIAAEADHVKRQKEQKERDLVAVEREHAQLKKEIDQLAKDKIKLEAEVRKLEAESLK